LSSTAIRFIAGTSVRSSSSLFCRQLGGEEIDAGRVAARSGEAGDEPKPDRVLGNQEHNGNCFGRLGCDDRSGRAGRNDHADTPANELGRQRRQPIRLILGPAKLDRDVLALDIAAFFEALPK
jgi:hypothetical protein